MDRLVAIGDIHGCLHTLKDLLRMVSYSSQLIRLCLLATILIAADSVAK